LKQKSEVLGVILFGSWARGNNRPDSDVDLVVIGCGSFRTTK
jgi:predicted nucleotidyltransferase